jgi:hypothetical protein
VSGTFIGKPNNSILTDGGNAWIISYTGGDGNDVTFTVATAPAKLPVVQFRPNWNNAALAGDTADLDKDNLENLVE